MSSQVEILILGLLLGVRHALDPDHLVAVSTIVSDCKKPLRAVWIGISWGLGHTLTLFLAGIILLILHIQMPLRLALGFEFLVGIMLLILGIQTLWSFRRQKVHVHVHRHADEGSEHKHFHMHQEASDHAHPHPVQHNHSGIAKVKSPIFRLKSFLVGTVHGLAGSAALMLLVLADIKSTGTGITYILLFGLGTALSMGMISILMSLPFSLSEKIPSLNRGIQGTAGALSIVFGLFMMAQIAYGL